MTADQNTSNTPQSPTKSLHLHCGNNVDILQSYPDCHFDVIITDPPYGIEFLGKDWDSHTGAVETWQQCLRVLKPGGYLLAFSAARTYHHLATNIESVGFEIRDQLMWIYSSGFPKAQDMGKSIERRAGKRKPLDNVDIRPEYSHAVKGYCKKCNKSENGTNMKICLDPDCPYKDYIRPAQNQWAGWKTALKPGHEPIVMARKPFKGSTIDNVLQHGVGALNINPSRIPYEDLDTPQAGDRTASFSFGHKDTVSGGDGSPEFQANPQGRYPSNVLGDIPDYQKYFYCPKVSRRERHCGFEQDHIPTPLENYSQGDVKNHPLWDPSIGTNLQRLKHKIMEHNKDLGKKTDSLSHLPTESSMLAAVGGYYVDAEGNRTETAGKNIWTPTTGMVYVHGLTKIYQQWCQTHNKTTAVGNNHPTVKPVALMRYLIQLVTPVNSKVLDPFMGSGSTGMAARELGHTFVGIDLDPAYVSIAQKRIEGWVRTETKKSDQSETAANSSPNDLWDDLFE